MSQIDPYTNQQGVMKNRLSIEDAETLSFAERDYSAARLYEIQTGEAPAETRGQFDADHLRAIHGHTFQDVYEWAGVTRGDDLMLEGVAHKQPEHLIKATTSFEEASQVNARLDAFCDRLAQQDHLRGLSREAFSQQAADAMSELNQIHPFREGNGRTQREFMTQLAQQAGHELSFEGVTQQRMTVASFDSAQGDKETMRRLFSEITDPDRSRLLQRGFNTLHERHGEKVQQVYLTTTTAGQEYAGQLHAKAQQHFVMRSTGDFVVGHAQDLPKASSAGDTVKITATHTPSAAQEKQAQRQQGLEY